MEPNAPTYQAFAPLYDFSGIEKAVQAYFCGIAGGTFEKPRDDEDPQREKWAPDAGNVAFYTAFQALTFQKCRPRVYISGFSINELKQYVLDAAGILRNKAWTGRMNFGVVTKPDYTYHTQLRAAVTAILPELQPLPVPADGSAIGTSGLNALLKIHEMGQFEMVAQDTIITPEDGNYRSMIPVALTFSVRATAWPRGTLTP